MIKKFLVFSFFTLVLVQGSILDDKIENFLGDSEYKKHHKLINILFENEEDFSDGETLKLSKILKVLKQNGLLNLKYDKPKELLVEFSISDSVVKSLKVLNDSLKSLGYYYYFTKKTISNADGSLHWVIKLQAEYAMDPLILSNELKLKEIFVKNITRIDSTHWKYEFDTKNAKMAKAIKIESNEKISFDKPLDNYLIEINNVDTLKIISRKLNRWYPYIVFYDEDLKVLKTIEKRRIYKGIKTSIPDNTTYIKIGDIYNLINIKRGLSIIVQNTQVGEI